MKRETPVSHRVAWWLTEGGTVFTHDKLKELSYLLAMEAFERSISDWLEDVIYPEPGDPSPQDRWEAGYCTAADEIKEIYTARLKAISSPRDPADPDLGNN